MAREETDPLCQSVPEPFVWTEGAHGLYLSFLEDAFVNDLYQRHYCSLDICGYSPLSTAHAPPSCIAAECSSPAPPQSAAIPQSSQPKDSSEPKARCKRSRTGSKVGSTRRKGKCLAEDVDRDKQSAFELCMGPDKEAFLLEQPGNSSQMFGSFECVVPKGPRGRLKRSRGMGVNVKFCGTERRAADQVVPSVYQGE